MAELDTELADHVERSAEAIARVNRDHALRAPPLQRLIERTTAFLARPNVIAVMWIVVIGWIALNAWSAARGLHPLDPPPFGWLELAASLSSVALASLILATQRRENELDKQRAQLILEFALLNEQKTAKLISLLEELRRDTPIVVDRVDAESELLSRPADTELVLDAITRRVEGLEDEESA